jgi:hypothetical protein
VEGERKERVDEDDGWKGSRRESVRVRRREDIGE